MQTISYVVAGDHVQVCIPETVADLEVFWQWLIKANQRGPVAFDTETTGLDIFSVGYRLRTAQFGDKHTGWVIHYERGGYFSHFVTKALQLVRALRIHNAPFDWLVTDTHVPGVTLDDLAPKTRDTSTKLRLIDPRAAHEGGVGAALKTACGFYVDPSAPDTQGDLTAVFRSLGLTKATGFAKIDLHHPTYNLYAGLDVVLTARLDEKLDAELDRLDVRPALVDYEHEVSHICATMQRTGILTDHEYALTLREELTEVEESFAAVAATYGVDNINARSQVVAALLGMGEELTATTASGGLKVDKAVLHELADLDQNSGKRLGNRTPNPLAEAVIKSKRAGKWRSAYADKFIQNADASGRIHPSIHTLAARTGRMSISGDLAAQTLPSSDWMIRRAIVAEPDSVMISTDFQAIEMRVLAALADVKRMKEAIRSGQDLHEYTASLVYGPNFTAKHRKICKGVGFGTVYGGGAATIARQTGAEEDAVRYAQERYHRAYPEIKRTSNKWQREAYATGMVTVSVTGRRLPLDRQRAYAVVNYQVQSAARDCLGQALIDMRERGLLPYLRLPIHDEVVASAPRSMAREVAREIEECMTFDLFGVPVAAEAEIGGRSWGSLYMKDSNGKYDPELLIKQDEYFAANPQEAYAKVA